MENVQQINYGYKQAYEDMELVLNNCFDQITIADKNGIFLKVSKSCQLFFGVSEEEIIGKSAFELEKRGVFSISVTAEVIRSGRKTTLIQKTASGKHLIVTGMPSYDETGNIKSIINISKDITETQRLNRELKEIQKELSCVKEELSQREKQGSNDLVQRSKSMRDVMNLIDHIADTEATVLLLGETGVGKGFMAKKIHNLSSKNNNPFISINCGAIPENLLESELFGYEQGAFTGASKNGKKGLFELAENGTIFLDEIGDLPLSLQVKLLHVMDSKEIYRIAGTKPIKINARIMAATNKNLRKMVANRDFREDLFYRLNVVPITIPPLRERKEDIPGLINLFLRNFNNSYSTNKIITQEAYNSLINYDLKGNIRELENIIERLVLTTIEDVIEFENINHIIKPQGTNHYDSFVDDVIPLKEAVNDLEKRILIATIEKYKTTRKVAEVLQIDQSTVVKKIKKLGIT